MSESNGRFRTIFYILSSCICMHTLYSNTQPYPHNNMSLDTMMQGIKQPLRGE